MSKLLGKRELLRKAYANAAAMLRDGDYSSIFGDEIADQITESEANESRADEAVAKAIAKLESLAGRAP